MTPADTTSPLPDVSIVIPTHNDADALPDVLAPLLADPATSEIVVIVDGSTDATMSLLGQAADPRIRPLWIKNSGPAGARQAGVDAACHEIVLMIDADVVAAPGLVSGHASWHADGTPRVVAGYMPTMVPALPGHGSFVLEQYAAQYESACRLYEDDARNVLVRHWAGNVSYPRTAILSAGGYEGLVPLLFMEDLEFGLRLADLGGLTPVFDRGLRAEHRLRRSISAFSRGSRRYGNAVVIVHQLHPGRVTDPPWLTATAGPHSTLRRFVSRPRGYAVVAFWINVLIAATALGRLWPLQRKLGMLLGHVEAMRGVVEEAQRRDAHR